MGAAGKYYGLFSDTNGVAHQSAGLIQLTVTSAKGRPGSFSGALWVEGEKVVFSGGFDVGGTGRLNKPVSRKGLTNEPINVVLQLDLQNGNVCAGTVSNADWESEFEADKAVYATVNPSPVQGPTRWCSRRPTGPVRVLPGMGMGH